MGLPFKHLYLSKSINDDILLLTGDYKPELDENGELTYPKSFYNVKSGKMEVPMGHDIFVPNVIGWEGVHEPMEVEAVRSTEETGIWACCFDDYFGGEHWLYTAKPEYIDNGKRGARVKSREDILNCGFGLHIGYESLKMEVGEGPIPVAFKIVNNKQEYNKHE